MNSHETDNKRIAKNTLLLYVRMGVMMILSFFTARITLQALGDEDYGIYNVVGGFVSMFSILSASLSASISRFITFGIGQGDINKLKNTFTVALNIQIAIVIIVLLLAESIGLWFINNKLVIPLDRIFAANIVYQISVASFAVFILSAPYTAAIIAHEKMKAFAYMTIFEATFKLFIVYCLLYVDNDTLILYASLMLIQTLIIQGIYMTYCHRNFKESRFSFCRDKTLYKEIFHFAGWNFIGSSASMLSDQGVNIMLNTFFGPIVNTARGIAMQISYMLTNFSNNFMMALNPQITKTYASEDIDRMHSLMKKGTKLSFFLFLMLSIPVLLETRQVLYLWLGQIPEYSISFAKLVIILTLSNMMSNTLITAQLATGKLRNYQICVGGVMLLNLPISYIALRLGYDPNITLVIALALSQCCMFIRLSFLQNMINLSMRSFLMDVYLRCVSAALISITVSWLVFRVLDESISRLIFVTFASIIITATTIYTIGCNKFERKLIKNYALKACSRIKR